MSTNPEYQKNYYNKNRELISELRKIRYHTDSKYREKVKRKSRQRYRNSQLRSPDKKIGYTVKVVDNQPLFSVKYVLQIIGKSKEFLSEWENRGDIPRSIYTDSRGWRLYTEYQIGLLGTAIEKYDSREWSRIEVRKYLHAGWETPNVCDESNRGLSKSSG